MLFMIAIGAGIFLLIILVVSLGYVGFVTHHIDQKIQQIHEAKSTLFYAYSRPLTKDQTFSPAGLNQYLNEHGFLLSKNVEDLQEGEYGWIEPQKKLKLHRTAFQGAGHLLDPDSYDLTFEDRQGSLALTKIVNAKTQADVPSIENSPKQIGAYFGGRFRIQNSIPISEIPLSMRLAIIAIEDVNFLEHHGVSLRAIARALWHDLRHLKFVEGGSTLTQQLMKNIFFTREKAISRKFKEAFFALITEMRHSKETILETYLNEVYLGQWGSYEIHGVGEGARFYFNRPVTQLSLAQSASLAAIVQAPNAMDPRKYPDRLKKRRDLALKKMFESDFISEEEYQEALAEKVQISNEKSIEDIGYFFDYLLSTLPGSLKNRLDKEALTVYTTLSPSLQNFASETLNTHIDKLEKYYYTLKKAKENGVPLQAALLAVDVKNCSILALQGGRNYRLAPFNRIVQAKRQPGSLFKPFVFLTAFDQATPSRPFSALTQIDDTPFEWKYEGQTWSPKNYDEKFRLHVTAREALENSINVPTARLAEQVGIPSIIRNLTAAGIRTTLPAVPSISLGSAEVPPIEVAETYMTLANLGQGCALRGFSEIYDENKNLIVENKVEFSKKLSPQSSFLTVDLMKGVFTHGTGKLVQGSKIPYNLFAGKTGTTSDYKDAWFAGFNRNFLVLIWVGYDQEKNVGLTGASAALPLWIDFVTKAENFYNREDFEVPEGIEKRGEEYFLPGQLPK